MTVALATETGTLDHVAPAPQKFPISWPIVVLALGLAAFLLTSVTLLTLHDKDVVPVLGAIGTLFLVGASVFGVSLNSKMGRVEEASNGRLSQLMDENKRLNEEAKALALQLQPPPVHDNPPPPQF